MRQSVFILSFCVLAFFGCKKDLADDGIYRQWTWENSIGGFDGHDTIQPSQDATVTLSFKKNMTYSTAINGETISDGTFQIVTLYNQRVLQINDFPMVEGLLLGNNGARIQIEGNNLHLTDYQASEPYTHNFHD